jgi:hypothetical protein
MRFPSPFGLAIVRLLYSPPVFLQVPAGHTGGVEQIGRNAGRGGVFHRARAKRSTRGRAFSEPSLFLGERDNFRFSFQRAPPSLRAQRSNPSCREERLDCFAALAMTEDIVPRSRGADRARVVGRTTLGNRRGRGECRVPNAPAASCALVVGVCTRVFTAEAPETSGIPHAMVLRLISRSPRGPGFLAPVIGGIASANLAPASGRQDHASSPSAATSLVLRSRA